MSACSRCRITEDSLVREDREGSGPAFAWDDVLLRPRRHPLSAPLQRGVHLLPPPVPAALSGRLATPLPRGRGYGFTTFCVGNGAGEVVPLGRWRVICGKGPLNPYTWPRTFWFQPVSTL